MLRVERLRMAINPSLSFLTRHSQHLVCYNPQIDHGLPSQLLADVLGFEPVSVLPSIVIIEKLEDHNTRAPILGMGWAG